MVAMEERRRRSSILLLGLYICLYMLVKHVVDIQNNAFAWRVREGCNIELGIHEYGA